MHFIDFTRTDLRTVSTAIASFLLYKRIHFSRKKSEIPVSGGASGSDESETNPEFESQNSKTSSDPLYLDKSACFELTAAGCFASASDLEFIINKLLSPGRITLGSVYSRSGKS